MTSPLPYWKPNKINPGKDSILNRGWFFFANGQIKRNNSIYDFLMDARIPARPNNNSLVKQRRLIYSHSSCNGIFPLRWEIVLQQNRWLAKSYIPSAWTILRRQPASGIKQHEIIIFCLVWISQLCQPKMPDGRATKCYLVAAGR